MMSIFDKYLSCVSETHEDTNFHLGASSRSC
jgi:hypothetical protein